MTMRGWSSQGKITQWRLFRTFSDLTRMGRRRRPRSRQVWLSWRRQRWSSRGCAMKRILTIAWYCLWMVILSWLRVWLISWCLLMRRIRYCLLILRVTQCFQNISKTNPLLFTDQNDKNSYLLNLLLSISKPSNPSSTAFWAEMATIRNFLEYLHSPCLPLRKISN